MDETIVATDDLFRPVLTEEQTARISTLFSSLPENKRAAVLVIADLSGTARATVAARLGKHFQVAAGAGYTLGEKRPSGYIGIEGSF